MRTPYLSLSRTLTIAILLPACGDSKGDETDTTAGLTTTGVTAGGTTGAESTDAITSTDPFTTADSTAEPASTSAGSTTADPSTTTTDPGTTTTGPGTTTTDPGTTTGETGDTTDATTGDETTGGGGLGEGEICQDMPDACAKGLLCCYPCGVPDCMNQCIKPDPNTNMCPLFP